MKKFSRSISNIPTFSRRKKKKSIAPSPKNEKKKLNHKRKPFLKNFLKDFMRLGGAATLHLQPHFTLSCIKKGSPLIFKHVALPGSNKD